MSASKVVERPLILRLLPNRLRMAAWWRLYRRHYKTWLPLYDNASLAADPKIGMKLMPGDILSDSIAFTGLYEPCLTSRLMTLARGGGTMIDVGANLGYFSLLWAAASPDNRCLALEPSPRVFGYLEENVRRNGLGERIDVNCTAASLAKGSAWFDLGIEGQGGWGGLLKEPRTNAIEVPVVRIDELVPVQPIALLKIDTEGADAWVLKGCAKLLQAHAVREIWYEQNGPRMRPLGIDPDEAQVFLRQHGYEPRLRQYCSKDNVQWMARPK